MNNQDQSRSDNYLHRRGFGRNAAVSALILPGLLHAEDKPSPLTINSPVSRQVIQRQGFIASQSHPHAQGGPKLGQARIEIQGRWAGASPATIQARCVLREGCIGTSVQWTKLGEVKPLQEFTLPLTIPAGGWYRLEVQALDGVGAIWGQAVVDPLGVGELFLISGQSYAAGANDEHLKIDDPLGRTVLYDWVAKAWRTANDPFPHVDSGGTIWPAFANLLQPMLGVPVGLLNVAVGGTASRQWLPGQELYNRFAAGGKALGRFRYVLWQQGESDVIENISTETYVDRLRVIRSNLSREWGFEPTWLLAKSTMHPTVYNKPVQEEQIRQAIGQLWRQPGFGPGPDTDILGGENRGGMKSRRHFSPIGQRRAGAMWFASVWAALQAEDQK